MPIITTKQRTINKAPHIAVYSRGKLGKTRFGAQAVLDAGDNGMMLLIGEDGLSEHKDLRTSVPVLQKADGDYDVIGENRNKDEWPRFLNILREIYKDWAAPGKVLTMDSVDLIVNGSCAEYCIDSYFETKQKYDTSTGRYVPKTKEEQAAEFGGTQLIRHMAAEFDRFLVAVKFLQNKGVTVYTTWHSSVFAVKSPFEDQDYNKISIDLKATKENNLREMLINAVSMLLYADVNTQYIKATKRVEGGDKPYLYTSPSAAYDTTKARGIQLPDEIPFVYAEFKKALLSTK